MTEPGVVTTEVPPVRAESAPQWETIDRDILCPLCDYNLRGLTEPRCPECGHKFEWIDVLDRSRWEHPWLFEHARRRKVRSLIRTFFVSLLPGRFWSSVKPTQTPRVVRLILFWLIVSVLCSIPWTRLKPIARMYRDLYSTGTSDSLPWPVRSRLFQKGYTVPQYSSRNNLSTPTYLMPIPWQLYPKPWELLAEPGYPLTASKIHVQLLIGFAAWPWLTAVTLLIFRQTMRQAKIKPSHVLRCAIYSGDCATLLAIPVMWLIIRSSGWLMYDERQVFIDYLGSAALLGFVAFMTYRLNIAYRIYLTFPQPLATCALAQLVVALLLLAVSGWHIVF